MSHGSRPLMNGRRSTPWATLTKADIIKPQYVVEKLDELTGGDAIITTEVGQNQMWAAQFYKFNKPRHMRPPADSAPWAMACRPPSAPRWHFRKK